MREKKTVVLRRLAHSAQRHLCADVHCFIFCFWFEFFFFRALCRGEVEGRGAQRAAGWSAGGMGRRGPGWAWGAWGRGEKEEKKKNSDVREQRDSVQVGKKKKKRKGGKQKYTGLICIQRRRGEHPESFFFVLFFAVVFCLCFFFIVQYRGKRAKQTRSARAHIHERTRILRTSGIPRGRAEGHGRPVGERVPPSARRDSAGPSSPNSAAATFRISPPVRRISAAAAAAISATAPTRPGGGGGGATDAHDIWGHDATIAHGRRQRRARRAGRRRGTRPHVG